MTYRLIRKVSFRDPDSLRTIYDRCEDSVYASNLDDAASYAHEIIERDSRLFAIRTATFALVAGSAK